MKSFADKFVDLILENEKARLDKIMNEVTDQISKDFELVALRYLDMYYENYDPTKYVRLYGKRDKYLKDKEKKDGISLHAAVSRNDGHLRKSEGSLLNENGLGSYVGGIQFDESYFKGNNMKHIDKGKTKSGQKFTEWNIIENFIYAGDGDRYSLTGDWRSQIEYNAPSLDEIMISYMEGYFPTFKKHYENAKKKSL